MNATHTAQAPAPRAPGKLISWKAIAQYFECDQRTARRWERERGLPVHRVPGGKRSAVFAYPSELDRWLQLGGHPLRAEPSQITAQPASHQADVPRSAGKRFWVTTAVTAALLLAAALAIAFYAAHRSAQRASAGVPAASGSPRHLPAPAAEELYLRGRYYWNLRTADSLSKAIDAYSQALVNDPAYAEAYAGLAESYDILPQFGHAHVSEAFARAESAADKALELSPNLASAHRAKAFALFFWDWDIAGSDAEFRRALALDPNSAETHHWYASTLINRLEGAECLRQIDEAQRLNPSSAAIATDSALIHATFGDNLENSVAKLREMEQTQPSLRTPADFLQGMAFAIGDNLAYLDQLHHIASITHSPDDIGIARNASLGWARARRLGMLEEVATSGKVAFDRGSQSGFTLGQTYLLLGRPRQALPYFTAALQQHDIMLITMEQCDWARGLSADPDYVALFAEIRSRLKNGGPAHPAVLPWSFRLPAPLPASAAQAR